MYSTSVSLLERLRQPAQPEAWGRFVELYTPLLYYWAPGWDCSRTTRRIWSRTFLPC